MKILRRFSIVAILLLVLFSFSCKKEEHVHNYEVLSVTKAATCTEDGEQILYCKGCNEQKTEVLPKTGHTIIPATCVSFEMCSTCGEVLGSELGEHNYIFSVVKEVTCETTGINSYVCSYCFDEKKEYVNPLGHDYSEWEVVKEATCSEDGLQKKTCSRCDKVAEEVIKSAHIYGEWNLIQNSTCSSEGLREHFCKNCDHVEREEIEKIDHEFGEWQTVIEPTCTIEGIDQRVCKHCDKVEARNIDKVSHDLGEWEVVKEPTCTNYGVKESTCLICYNPFHELVDKIDHNYVDTDGHVSCSICNLSNDDINNIIDKIETLEFKVDSMEGLILPSEVEGISLTWKSYSPDVVLDDGTVYAKNVVQDAIMMASFNYSGVDFNVKFDVKIPVIDTAKITYCWNAYYSLKIPQATATDVRFLTKDYGGVCSVVKYVSSNDNVIDANGKIYQKTYDQEATITCYLQVGKVIMGYSRTITVKSYSDLQCIDYVMDWLPGIVDELKNGNIDQLPTSHELYGTNITWFCMEPGIIAGEGVFVMPMTPQNIELEATIFSGEYSRTLTYSIENIGGDTTFEEQLLQWMKGQIPSRIRGTRNFVKASDAFDYQIRTNDRGVLNLIDGTFPEVDRSLIIDTTLNTWVNRMWGSGRLNTDIKPELTQEVLDKMMYTGYQKPNDDNILWITIHESGMPRVGNDALLLAQIQMDTAVGKRSRQASWNYQVDENKIYQSFEDNVICWHASDGSATPGNGNTSSIGIEMCINEDGNYDGAMHLDAKLVAMLLTKYNLKLENIKRHFDFAPDKKQCPYYMIEVGRWNEFLNLVDKEYTAMKLLKDAKVSWSVTTDDNSNTNDVLNKYFIKGGSTLWFSKPVLKEEVIHITMTVEIGGKVYTHTNDLTLYPNV